MAVAPASHLHQRHLAPPAPSPSSLPFPFLSSLQDTSDLSAPQPDHLPSSVLAPAFFALLFFILASCTIHLFRHLVQYLPTTWIPNHGAATGGGAGGGQGLRWRKAEGGLHPAILAKFKVLPYANVKEEVRETVCMVCLMEFGDADFVQLLPACDHAFHPACVDPWFATHATCPTCRSNLATLPDMAAVTVAVDGGGGGGGGES